MVLKPARVQACTDLESLGLICLMHVPDHTELSKLVLLCPVHISVVSLCAMDDSGHTILSIYCLSTPVNVRIDMRSAIMGAALTVEVIHKMVQVAYAQQRAAA